MRAAGVHSARREPLRQPLRQPRREPRREARRQPRQDRGHFRDYSGLTSWPGREVALLVGVLLCAASVFTGMFTGWACLAPLFGAVIAATVLTYALAVLWPVNPAAVARSRWDTVAVVAALCGFAVYAPVVLFGFGFGAFARGLGAGWTTVLTVGLPADPTGAALVLPALVLWVATVGAVLLALRTSSVFGPLMPPLAVFVVALLLAAGAGRSGLPQTAALAAAGLSFALVRGSRTALAGPRPAGALVLGFPVVAIAALGTAAGVFVGATHRVDVRDLRRAPVTVDTAVNPLVQVRSQLTANVPVTIALVRLASSSGRLPADRLTTAILGDFDGASWTDGGSFVTVGHTLPHVTTPVAGEKVTVVADVTLRHPQSPFLLSPGQPVRLTGASAAFDPGTGTLVATGPVTRYTVTATEPAPSPRALAGAVAGSGPSLTPYLALPAGLPPQLTEVADTITAGTTTPYGELTALGDYLRNPKTFPYDLGGRPGHSYGTITRLLTSGDPDDRRDYAEQHAAAFALLARTLGFPSRIAVGYLIDPRSADGHGTFTITGATAHAWPEVYLDGLGWIPFEPTDTSHLSARQPMTGAPTGGGDGPAVSTAERTITPLRVAALPDIGAGPGGGTGGRALLTAGLVLLGLLMALAGTMIAVVAEKARRRWRRRAARPPHRRIAGAWWEARDRLSERGVPTGRALSAGEVAAYTRVLGDRAAAPVGALVPLLSSALFSPADPTQADAEQAWELVAVLRRELRTCAPLPRRLAAAADPRSLVRR